MKHLMKCTDMCSVSQCKEMERKIIHIHAYLLAPWSRVLLEKLTGLQLVKKFPAFYGIRKFITTFTSARHMSLPWSSSIQSIPPHTTCWRSILILPSHLRLKSPQWSRTHRFPHENPVHDSSFPHTRYMSRPSHSSRFYHPHNIGSGVQNIKLLIM